MSAQIGSLRVILAELRESLDATLFQTAKAVEMLSTPNSALYAAAIRLEAPYRSFSSHCGSILDYHRIFGSSPQGDAVKVSTASCDPVRYRESVALQQVRVRYFADGLQASAVSKADKTAIACYGQFIAELIAVQEIVQPVGGNLLVESLPLEQWQQQWIPHQTTYPQNIDEQWGVVIKVPQQSILKLCRGIEETLLIYDQHH